MWKPEFFDIFGSLAFAYITGFAIWALRTQTLEPKWPLIILLVVGLGGLLVDVTIVYRAYLK